MVRYYGRAKQRTGSVNTNQIGLKMSGCPPTVGKRGLIDRYMQIHSKCNVKFCGNVNYHGVIWSTNTRNCVPRQAKTASLAGGVGNINAPRFKCRCGSGPSLNLLQEFLNGVIAKYALLPAITAGIIYGDGTSKVASSGIKSLNPGNSVDGDTLFLLGSTTKAMTSAMIMKVGYYYSTHGTTAQKNAAAKILDMSLSMDDVFGAGAADNYHILTGYQVATLEDLLCMRAGIVWESGIPSFSVNDISCVTTNSIPLHSYFASYFQNKVAEGHPFELRKELTKWICGNDSVPTSGRPTPLKNAGIGTPSQGPAWEIGAGVTNGAYYYANESYIIAAHMIEAWIRINDAGNAKYPLADTATYEKLMHDFLFTPLGMNAKLYGEPGFDENMAGMHSFFRPPLQSSAELRFPQWINWEVIAHAPAGLWPADASGTLIAYALNMGSPDGAVPAPTFGTPPTTVDAIGYCPDPTSTVPNPSIYRSFVVEPSYGPAYYTFHGPAGGVLTNTSSALKFYYTAMMKKESFLPIERWDILLGHGSYYATKNFHLNEFSYDSTAAINRTAPLDPADASDHCGNGANPCIKPNQPLHTPRYTYGWLSGRPGHPVPGFTLYNYTGSPNYLGISQLYLQISNGPANASSNWAKLVIINQAGPAPTLNGSEAPPIVETVNFLGKRAYLEEALPGRWPHNY